MTVRYNPSCKWVVSRGFGLGNAKFFMLLDTKQVQGTFLARATSPAVCKGNTAEGSSASYSYM